MDFFKINTPVNDLKPQAGRLLIAEPFLNDPNFVRSVILICEHNEEGTVGFALNKAITLTLGDVLPELYASSLPLYQGGPVQLDTLHIIHRVPALLGGNEIVSGLYWGGAYRVLQDAVLNNTYAARDIRLFVGYSGWSTGQLEEELNEGSWIVSEYHDDIIFETDAASVWKQAVRHLGRPFAYMANMPVNPLLN